MRKLHNILYQSDPAVGGSVTETPSVLEEDLHGTDTSMPVLAPGLYDMEVDEVTEGPNSEGTGRVLKIKLKTVEDGRSTKGEVLQKGFPLYDNIPLTPTEKMPADRIKKRLAQFMEGCDGVASKIAPLAQWKGKRVTVKVKIQKETEEYPEAARVNMYVKKEA